MDWFTQALSLMPVVLPAALVLVLAVLVVCWIVVPFGVLGTKPLLRQLIEETRRTNELLAQRLPDLRPKPEQTSARPAQADRFERREPYISNVKELATRGR